MTLTYRAPSLSDATRLAMFYRRNRDHMRTGSPRRAQSFYTATGQETAIRNAKADQEASRGFFWLIEDNTQILGLLHLNSVVYGAFRSASIAYTVDRQHTGQGIATSAVRWAIEYAFTTLGLHRLQGETLVSNHASQAVLSKCGFTQYGLAPKYLYIDGSWQGHALYQLINTTYDEAVR
ncbi:GNAT family N-acetyltransferase [Kocuria koreensis]|uniref:GNAT family N-acetyltransferase n=2 Tax=Rothia koreensis TaxID=592378 RepID=A0A7K1LFT9_9MICC|nr:GNAT family N-acetyltransferase [Rothia koreensis]